VIGWRCRVAFLDEFRVVVSYHGNLSDTVLVVINTFVPQEHPNNVRRFLCPQKYLGCGPEVYLGHDRSLGAMDGDDRFIADPSQAILMTSLSPGDCAFLILRTQSLIEHSCSMRADVQIPWDEWGKDAVVMENPRDYSFSDTFIHGARVLVIRTPLGAPEGHHRVYAFDFSRRRSATLPLSDGSEGGTESLAVFEEGQSCVFEMGDGANRPRLVALGDSVMFHIVS